MCYPTQLLPLSFLQYALSGDIHTRNLGGKDLQRGDLRRMHPKQHTVEVCQALFVN